MEDTATARDADVVQDYADLTLADLRAALVAAGRDLHRAPQFGLFFSSIFVAGGWFLTWVLGTAGQIWWTIPLTLGFPLLGPFIACGYYEVSRRLETGEPLSWPAILGAVSRQRDRQIPSLAAVVVIFFLFWNFLAHMIFALFMGLAVMTNVSSSFEAFVTPNGIAMLAVGTAIGAIFSIILFSMTVIAIPLLMEKEMDFVTAMLTSADVVRQNLRVMLIWGLMIAVILFVAMLPAFMGLFIALPLLGHASWHIYRRAVIWS